MELVHLTSSAIALIGVRPFFQFKYAPSALFDSYLTEFDLAAGGSPRLARLTSFVFFFLRACTLQCSGHYFLEGFSVGC
jgi:hypothetical protein